MDGHGCITIHRPTAWRDRFRAHWVEIDGARVGKVKAGQRVEFSVAPGLHAVNTAIDWVRSPVVSVEVAAGEMVTLVDRPTGSPGAAQLDVARGTWLTLCRE